MQIDLTSALTIGGIIFGLIGALIKIIRDMDAKRVMAIEKTLGECTEKLKEQHGEMKTLHAAADNATTHSMGLERRLEDAIRHQEELYERLFKRTEENMKRVEDVKDKFLETSESHREALADVRETIAGFGATYVTRKDFSREKERNNEE